MFWLCYVVRGTGWSGWSGWFCGYGCVVRGTGWSGWSGWSGWCRYGCARGNLPKLESDPTIPISTTRFRFYHSDFDSTPSSSRQLFNVNPGLRITDWSTGWAPQEVINFCTQKTYLPQINTQGFSFFSQALWQHLQIAINWGYYHINKKTSFILWVIHIYIYTYT